jgi:hypothetical protein
MGAFFRENGFSRCLFPLLSWFSRPWKAVRFAKLIVSFDFGGTSQNLCFRSKNLDSGKDPAWAFPLSAAYCLENQIGSQRRLRVAVPEAGSDFGIAEVKRPLKMPLITPPIVSRE